MTVLPRNPVEMPANPMQSHNAASGRAGSNSGPHAAATESEGDAQPSFSTLLGMVTRTGESDLKEVGNDRSVRPEPERLDRGVEFGLDQQLSLTGERVGLPDEPVVQVGLIRATPLAAQSEFGDDALPRLEGLQRTPPTAGTGVPASGQSAGELAAPNAAAPESKGVHVQPAGTVLRVQENSGAGRVSKPTPEPGGKTADEPKAQNEHPPLRDAANTIPANKIENSAVVRSDLASLRLDVGTSERERTSPRAKPVSSPAAPAARLQPVSELRPEGGQIRPAPVQAEFAGVPIQPADPGGAAPNAVSNISQVSGGASDDLPRLQDVKVLSTRTIEVAPGAADRAGQGNSVKVIDLQLQPETLGRINAQLKRSGEVLEVRLEPSLAETALLLKEDRLALQRILGALGSVTDPAIVRIVEPAAEQRQVDGQEAVADHELGEAGYNGDQSFTSEDLRAQGRGGGDLQHQQPDADQGVVDGNPRRASDDIYI